MKKATIILGISFFIILQSCYFGAGLVEKEITEDYILFANSSLDEMSIWFKDEKHSSRLIVPETVFAVGQNENYIIAKSHPKNAETGVDKSVIYYHIIDTRKKGNEQYINLSIEQFQSLKQNFKISNDLGFESVYED
ncbi:MAG: hypothetical protein CL613_03850 [Aquimarina sp.]|nr:hypothetical protein [Aquimarina sp.]